MRLLASLAIATTVTVTAGCGSSDEGAVGSHFMSYPELVKEYRAKVDSYPAPLPTGISFPRKPRKPKEVTLFEPGEGVVTADEFWICAWTGEWLKTRGKDSRRASVAMSWVDKAEGTEFHRLHYSDPNHVWRDEIVGKAKLGDITNLRDYYANGCAQREGLGPVG